MSSSFREPQPCRTYGGVLANGIRPGPARRPRPAAGARQRASRGSAPRPVSHGTGPGTPSGPPSPPREPPRGSSGAARDDHALHVVGGELHRVRGRLADTFRSADRQDRLGQPSFLTLLVLRDGGI